MSLRKSSSSRKGSKSVVFPNPKARRKCTPAPSMVGFDLINRRTGRMDMLPSRFDGSLPAKAPAAAFAAARLPIPPPCAATSSLSDASGPAKCLWKGGNLMQPPIDYRKHAQEPLQSLYAIESYVAASGLEEKLLHLVRTRASQINGCAFCLDMHTIDARAAGETEQRLYTLDAWRETPFFSDRERAALAWVEAVTLLAKTHVPDSVYEEARKHFSEQELVDLTYLAATINAWNRIAESFRAVPGRYKAKSAVA